MSLIGLGLILIVVGIIILTISSFFNIKGKSKIEGGGLIMIGPIPIIFGTNIKLIYILLLITAVIIIFYVIMLPKTFI